MNREKCPYCKIKLVEYQDYSDNVWLGCPKCEDYEELKEIEK